MKKSILIAALFQVPVLCIAGTGGQTDLQKELRTLFTSAQKSSGGIKTFYTSVHEKYGSSAAPWLEKLANNDRETDALRWACVFALARESGSKSTAALKRFVDHPNWLLRDAALKNITSLNVKELEPEIKARLKDSSLIVRTTAVDAIEHLGLKESSPALVKALFDPLNYRNGEPLWIDKHILSALSELRYTPAVSKLVALLDVKDAKSLQPDVIKTLERITGHGYSGKSVQEQVFLWKRNTASEKSY